MEGYVGFKLVLTWGVGDHLSYEDQKIDWKQDHCKLVTADSQNVGR